MVCSALMDLKSIAYGAYVLKKYKLCSSIEDAVLASSQVEGRGSNYAC